MICTSCLPLVGGSPLGTSAFSTTKTGCHDIAEILLKVTLNTKDQSEFFHEGNSPMHRDSRCDDHYLNN
jgi:hypothetical protein